MAREAAERRYDAVHEKEPFHDGTFSSWAKEPSGRHPFRHTDGVTIWIADRDLTPDDDFI